MLESLINSELGKVFNWLSSNNLSLNIDGRVKFCSFPSNSKKTAGTGYVIYKQSDVIPRKLPLDTLEFT